MENWENKIIADKLNSLADLPEGYSPNLSSKWEIVKQSLPKKSPGRSVGKWSIGLLLLLLLVITVCLFYSAKENGAVKNNFTIDTAPKSNEGVTVTQPQHTATVTKEKIESKKTVPATKQRIQALPRRKNPIESIISNSNKAFTDSLRIQKDSIKALPPVAEVKPAPTRKVYQKDFAGIGSVDTTQIKTAHKKIEIRFNLRNDKNAAGNSSSPSLRLSQNF